MILGKFYKHKDSKDLVIEIHTFKEEQDHVVIGYNMFNMHWFEIVPSARPIYLGSHMSNVSKDSLSNWKEYNK